MPHLKFNQLGFAPLILMLVVAVITVIGFAGFNISQKDKPVVSRENSITPTAPLSPADTTLLAQAKELKKIDFDLDGQVNSVDADDDNDGQNDDVDNDDDNDGQNDDVDNDDDNDGTTDDKDDEDDEKTEAAELQRGSQNQ